MVVSCGRADLHVAMRGMVLIQSTTMAVSGSRNSMATRSPVLRMLVSSRAATPQRLSSSEQTRCVGEV